jgi:hypothetical protein
MNNIYDTIKSNIPKLLNELGRIHKEYIIVGGRILDKDYISRRIIIMNKNNDVIGRVNDIFRAVITNKKDMYLYVLSVLTDINYDTLKEEWDNRKDNKCHIAINRELVKKAMISHTSENLNALINPGITLGDCIKKKFAIEDLEGDIIDYEVFDCLFGYLRMSKFLGVNGEEAETI